MPVTIYDKTNPDPITRAKNDLEHLRAVDAQDQSQIEKIAARRAERAIRITKLETMLEVHEEYENLAKEKAQVRPLREFPAEAVQKIAAKRKGGGRLGPVAVAILGLKPLETGLRNAEIIALLRSKHPELKLPEKDVKEVYNALYGLTKSGKLEREDGEDGAYRFPPKQIDPPKAKANGGSIPGHVTADPRAHVLSH